MRTVTFLEINYNIKDIKADFLLCNLPEWNPELAHAVERVRDKCFCIIKWTKYKTKKVLRARAEREADCLRDQRNT